MSLIFPTQAEQCEQSFRAAIKTTSLSQVALRMGGERTRGKNWPRAIRVYVFDDDTRLEASGTGKNLRIETFHP